MRRLLVVHLAQAGLFALLAAVACAQTLPTQTATPDPLADGIALQTSKDYSAALSFFQGACARADLPDKVRARAKARVGFTYVYMGDRANALRTYLDVADQFAGQKEIACTALVNAGHLYAQDKDYLNAIASYRRAIKAYGDAPEARKWAAQAQLRIGMAYLGYHDPALAGGRDIRKAHDAFEQVLKTYPDQIEWATEARLQLLALNLEFAINGWAGLDDVVKECDSFAKANPGDVERLPTAHLVRAEALYHLERFDDAIGAISLVQQQGRKDSAPWGTSHFLLAQCYDRKGDFSRAIAQYQRFLDNVTTSFSAWEERPAAQYGIGTCLRALERPREAEQAFAKLKAEYPGSYFAGLVAQEQRP